MPSQRAKDILKLDDRLIDIVEQEYPKFSPAEMDRRRKLLQVAMADHAVDHVLVYGSGFRGSAVPWLCQWAVSTEAELIFSPGERDALFVQMYNHFPLARTLTTEANVAWGGTSTIAKSIEELERRGAKEGRVGVIGPLPFGQFKALEAKFGTIVDMNRAYGRLRLVKSPEEIDWFRIGARLSDLPIEALCEQIRPGLTERDLGAITEATYLPWGGVNVIHFFAVNPMSDPQYCVPRQHPSTRRVQKGDVISTEITASFWEYSGQVLRTFFVGEEPTPLFKELHDVAEAAYDAILAVCKPGTHVRELVAAAQVIEDAGFSTYDDLVHGFGGAYLPPILGSPSRQNDAIPDMTLMPGMMMVIQPNVITRDEKAGVQTGECVLVTETGAESIHTAPRGPFRVG